MTIPEIRQLSATFTSHALSGMDPTQMCFTICYPLHIYLNVVKVKNNIAIGWYKASVPSPTPHYWIILSDYADCIIDPSIQQFEPAAPMVYAGPAPETHQLQTRYELCDSITKWQKGLLDEENSRIDIARYLPVNLRAAEEVLHAIAVNHKSIDWKERYKNYFDCILEIVAKYNSRFSITADQFPHLFKQLKL